MLSGGDSKLKVFKWILLSLYTYVDVTCIRVLKCVVGWCFGFRFSVKRNPKLQVDNQNDSLMHFLVMNCNGQVATYDCNGQNNF